MSTPGEVMPVVVGRPVRREPSTAAPAASAELDVHGAVTLTDLRNPYLAYLTSLREGPSADTIRRALNRIVELHAAARGLPRRQLTALGEEYGRFFPWHQLRYEHTLLLAQTLKDQRWAPATINKHLAALRGVLRTAMLLGLMTKEEQERASAIRDVDPSDARAGRDVPDEEIALLLGAAAADPKEAFALRDAAILALLYGAGLRRAEATALQRTDYDGQQVTVYGKRGRIRTLPLGPDVRHHLDAWLSYTGHKRGPLFFSARQAPSVRAGTVQVADLAHLKPDTIEKILDKLIARTDLAARPGYTNLNPHDCRHAFISDRLAATGDVSTVQRLAGHANPATTTGYDRRGPDTLREAMHGRTLPPPRPPAS